MKRFPAILLFLLWTRLFCYEVINYSDSFIDFERDNRIIDVQIFYPDDSPGEDAFPVIIFGHGWLLNYSYYSSLSQELVSSGMIMVFPTTESGLFPGHADFALDISFLAGAIQLENSDPASNLYNIVLPVSVAMGHSMGGGCSVLAASDSTNFTSLINFNAAETDPSAIQAAFSVDCPSLIFAAADDIITPPNTNQYPIYQNLSADLKYYIIMNNENHISLISNENVPVILSPFLTYLVTNDEEHLINFHSILDSLQTNNVLSYEYEYNVFSKENVVVADDFYLSNHPNPFNPSTEIRLQLSDSRQIENAEIIIYNLIGQKVKSFDSAQDDNQGNYFVNWNGDDDFGKPLSSGVYFYRLNVNGKTEAVNKCILMK